MSKNDMVQAEELLLLSQVLEGSTKAFGNFHERYRRLVISCVRRVFHKHTVDVSMEDLEDTVGQAFLNMVKDDFRKLRLYDSEKGYKLSSWIGLIATNTAYDHLRKRGPRVASLDDDERYVPEPVSHTPTPPEQLEEQEQIDLLLLAIEQLSKNERRFVELCYEHQLTHEEIAAKLGLSLNTVYSKKNKIKVKLAGIVEKLSQKRGH